MRLLKGSECNLFAVLADHDRHRGRRQVPRERQRGERDASVRRGEETQRVASRKKSLLEEKGAR
jgi:hypothetical protein